MARARTPDISVRSRCSSRAARRARVRSPPRRRAQDVYPSKPITLVVPFPPGGVADIVARPVADAMSRVLNTPVVIENKAGAGGGIGMGYVAKAKPDGYTLLLALSSISIIPEADKVTGRAPMYQLDQFVADRALHRRSDRARGARGEPVEDACRSSSPTRASGPARSPTARRATTARCTCRWRCSRRAPTSSCCTCPTPAAAPRWSRFSAATSTRCRPARRP